MDAYTAYSNPRGFIYQNKDKKNKLMHIDELHKFSDGTLDDVRNTLNDRLKGIMMEYLPQTIWRQIEGIEILSFLSAYFIALREDTQQFSMGDFDTGYSLKDKNEAKNNKTEHGMEEREKTKSKSTPTKSKPKPKTKNT
ncbi:hypothetical protein Tco_0535990 [Tanacetum coccineum]